MIDADRASEDQFIILARRDRQADPNFNNEQHLTNPHDWDALPDYVDMLRTQTMNFSGQVVLVRGDSH
jgi:hypothetical protein